MPTARELLEQADALMRRNRAPGQESDIPELTDEIAVAAAATGAPSRAMMVSRSTPQRRHSRDDDVPELNDAVEELSLHPLPDDEGEVSRWLEGDLGESSITGPAPDSIAVVPPSTLRAPPPEVETPLNAGSGIAGAHRAHASRDTRCPGDGNAVQRPRRATSGQRSWIRRNAGH